MPKLEQEVRKFVVDNFLFGQDDPDLGDEDSLLDKGVIDSTGVLELTGFLEKRFGITIRDQELVPDNLDSIGRIARFVEGKRQAGRAAVSPGPAPRLPSVGAP